MKKKKEPRQWSPAMTWLTERLKEFDWPGVMENISELHKIKDDEVFPAVYGIILAACYTIPAENPEIPDDILRLLELLNQRGYDINMVAPNGYTLLHKAAVAIQPGLIRYLLSHGADPNINTTFGTAMHEVIGRWLNIVYSDKYDESTLKITQTLAQQSIVTLLEAGYDVNIENPHCGMPIVALTQIKSLEMVSLFLDYGTPFSSRSDPEKVLIEEAIDRGTPEILRLLIEYGLDVKNTLLTRKATPLKYALKKGKNEIAQVITEAIEHPEIFVRKYPTKRRPQMNTNEQSVKNIGSSDNNLWNIVEGEWKIDIDATIDYLIAREKAKLGNRWQKEMEDETRDYWHRQAASLSDTSVLFEPGTMILRNDDDEETFSVSIQAQEEKRHILFMAL